MLDDAKVRTCPKRCHRWYGGAWCEVRDGDWFDDPEGQFEPLGPVAYCFGPPAAELHPEGKFVEMVPLEVAVEELVRAAEEIGGCDRIAPCKSEHCGDPGCRNALRDYLRKQAKEADPRG